jgi:MarR family transcriptional regulator, organic hydroperoxide resistance regulator
VKTDEKTNTSKPAQPNDRPEKRQFKSRAALPRRPELRESRTSAFRVPATISLPALLNEQSDGQFRGLIRDLLTVARRLETARDYFGRRIDVTGPQYTLLMTVAQHQGATGVSVGSVAQAIHVSSAFVTAESGKLCRTGLLEKLPNPEDHRGALLRLTSTGRTKLHRLAAEIRSVNDLFFGLLSVRSFNELCAGAAALVRGSREALQYITGVEEEPE